MTDGDGVEEKWTQAIIERCSLAAALFQSFRISKPLNEIVLEVLLATSVRVGR